MSHLGPPPRWMRCPRKGSIVADKFIPFKVPLNEFYDSQVPDECRFYPEMIFTSIKAQKKKVSLIMRVSQFISPLLKIFDLDFFHVNFQIGLWVDLTNTDRYYDKNIIEDNECKYLKLACKGRGECPSEEVIQTFITVVDQFISKNPLSLVGIHCTHGFNRTGFLIGENLEKF